MMQVEKAVQHAQLSACRSALMQSSEKLAASDAISRMHNVCICSGMPVAIDGIFEHA